MTSFLAPFFALAPLFALAFAVLFVRWLFVQANSRLRREKLSQADLAQMSIALVKSA